MPDGRAGNTVSPPRLLSRVRDGDAVQQPAGGPRAGGEFSNDRSAISTLHTIDWLKEKVNRYFF